MSQNTSFVVRLIRNTIAQTEWLSKKGKIAYRNFENFHHREFSQQPHPILCIFVGVVLIALCFLLLPFVLFFAVLKSV